MFFGVWRPWGAFAGILFALSSIGAGAPAQTDAVVILRECQSYIQRLKTYRVESLCTVSLGVQGVVSTGTVLFESPDKYLSTSWTAGYDTVVCTMGSSTTTYQISPYGCVSFDLPEKRPSGYRISDSAGMLGTVLGLLAPRNLLPMSAELVSSETIRGMRCNRIRITQPDGFAEVWIREGDEPTPVYAVRQPQSQPMAMQISLDWFPNAPIPRSTFPYKPPPGIPVMKMPGPGEGGRSGARRP